MSVLNSLENRFGRCAIPGVIAIIAGFQALVWILVTINRDFLSYLVLSKPHVLDGQVWRLITWVFIPTSLNWLWVLMAVMILMTVSSVLDRAWGPFRTNLYIFGGIISMIVGAMVFNSPPVGLTLYTSIFLAFACILPDYEFLLFFILPVKVKYLGMITGALTFLTFLTSPEMRGPIIFSLLNFFIAFGPGFIKGMKHRATVTERRARFASAQQADEPHFHKCHQCGKTDVDDPKLEFRVTDDGDEYCTICRPRRETQPT